MYKTHMNTFGNSIQTRSAAATGLSVVGFVALVAAGMWLAVYSTRYVPTVVNGAGAAAVYLSSVFNHSTATLSVVPTLVASSTISSTASSTISTSISSTPKETLVTNWTPGTPVAVTGGSASSPATPSYYGSPDLIVVIEDVGYSTVDGVIVSTTTIPAHTHAAVKFRVTNIGTNESGPWTLKIAMPSGSISDRVFSQPTLVPSQPSEYIAYFVDVIPGANRTAIITIVPNNQLTDSNTGNNTATSASITFLGS